MTLYCISQGACRRILRKEGGTFALKKKPRLSIYICYLGLSDSAMDLSMLTYFGSRERTEDDWLWMLNEADPRFKLISVSKPAAPGISPLLVVEWLPSEG